MIAFTSLFRLWITLNTLIRADACAPYDDLPRAEAFVHGYLAVQASTPDVSEHEIIRIARRESRFKPRASSSKRLWPGRAEDFPRRKKYDACGTMQVVTYAKHHGGWLGAARECLRLQDLATGYRAGAQHMQGWHDACRAWGRRGHRRYRCARAGYADGTEAARKV